MGIGIRYLDYYIPDKKFPISELVNQVKIDHLPRDLQNKNDYISFCKNNLKLQSIRVEDKLRDYEMIERLLDKLFLREIRPDEIDTIIFAQERFNYSTENIAQYIQYKYQIKNASVFNVSGSHCTNVELAIKIGKSILAENKRCRNILIISVQIIKEANKRIIGKTALLGDGAGLLLLSRENVFISIEDINILNNGYFYKPERNDDNFMLLYKWSHKSLDSIFHRNCIEPEKIKKVIVQNINPYANEIYLEKYNIQKDRIFEDNVGKYGHLTCIDFIINMYDYLKNNTLLPGNLILSYGMGWAGSFTSSLFCME